MPSNYYDTSSPAYRHLLHMRGSVFPKAFKVSFPVALITGGIALLFDIRSIGKPIFDGSQMWAGFNMALGFLLVFRTQQAYARWWEGGSLLQQIRGEWYNAISSLIAFTAREKARRKEVVEFQHLVVRLMSLLYCSALQDVADLPDSAFETLNLEGMEEETMMYLMANSRRCEVIVQWIQRLICDGMTSGILPVAAPVISRVFQELSRGMVNFNNLMKLRSFPFPFPYMQIINLLLILQWLITPVANYLLVENVGWAAVLSFISVFSFWSINYIAQEIESPFGSDANDLPIVDMQKDMNNSLWILLERKAQKPPRFEFHEQEHATRKSAGAMPRRSNMKIRNRSGTRNLREIWTEMLRESQTSHQATDGRSTSTLMTGSHEMMSEELSGASGATIIGATNTAGGAIASWAVMPLRTGPKAGGRSQTNDFFNAPSRNCHDYKSVSTAGRSQTKDLHPARKKEHRSYVGDGESDGEDDSQAFHLCQASLQTSPNPTALSTDSLVKGTTHSSNDLHSRHTQGKTASNQSYFSGLSSLGSGDNLTVLQAEMATLQTLPTLTTPSRATPVSSEKAMRAEMIPTDSDHVAWV